MSSPPTTGNQEMQTQAARYNTFQIAHQLSKRRASSQTTSNSSKKRGAAANNAIEWPHQRPLPEELARAGFFYKPAPESHDNVQCFHCAVRLDGWEADDDPLSEHLAHSTSCQWALSLSAGERARQYGLEDAIDPMSEVLVNARRDTFEKWPTWPHEGKKGWKCKVAKMVEAGWSYDPGPAATEGDEEEADGVTCFYCNLSLDGWEPKDDPMVEHKKRSPDCAFFALVEKFGSGAQKKAKGRGKKAGARASTASKASSRLSTQSAISVLSHEPSLADIGLGMDGEVIDEAAFDDSIMSTASVATATGTTKGKKKGGRPKAAAKGAKGRKRADTVDSQAEPDVMYPDLGTQSQDIASQQQESGASPQMVLPEEPAPAPAPAKKGRKGTQQSKQAQVDSSVIEISSMDVAGPAKKATRGRKAKAQPASQSQSEDRADDSEVSAQLQDELERSLSFDIQDDLDQSTPQPERPKRGVKRTSDGVQKKLWMEEDVSHVLIEFPVPPKSAAPAAKGKRGRQASKQIGASQESRIEEASQQPASTQEDVVMSEAEVEVTKPKAKKAATTKGKGKGKKASSTRSSRSSKATVITAEPEQPAWPETEEDLERDEREIEAELERIAAEQAAMQAEQEKAAEFEPSPSHDRTDRLSHASKHSRNSTTQRPVSPPPQLPPLNLSSKNGTPSPTDSDKENNPTPALAATTKPAPVLTSPTKTIRVPLAPGTPNRNLSPSKRPLSPSKSTTFAPLTSIHPWQPIDLDALLLASPQPTPGTLASRLVSAAGNLSADEGGLTVEAWVRLQAEQAEEELRRRCEGLVGGFEREGVRALEAVGGIVVG